MKRNTIWILAASLALLVMGCENEPDPVAVESITFIPDTLMLGVGDTVSLTVTVEPWDPLRTLTWESSDSAVVTVEYGEVTAVTVGKAIITLKAGGKQATCEVTVHVHFYSEGKCTVCGAEMKIEGYVIEDGGVLRGYYGDAAEVVIPEGITGIGKGAFYNKKNIKSVAIPGSVKSIGYSSDSLGFGAFEWCENLKTVTMDEGVESIGYQAFDHCMSLTDVKIPDSVKSIGDNAFYNCMSLASVTIGKGVESIGDRVFCGCTKLTDVKIPDSVKSIGNNAFWRCTSLASVTIGKGVESIGYNAFEECTNLASVIYEGTLAQWCAMGNDYCLMSNAKTVTLDGIPNLRDMTELIIPDGTERIGGYAFQGCKNIKSVTIPASVTSIGDSAFYGCSGFVVTYKGTLAQWCAMSNDSSLMSIARTVTLDGIPNLKTVTELVIPESVESIGDRAFYNCTSLASVTIPASVTEIGSGAFRSCYSLKTVNYDGTEEQWKAIAKGSYYGLSGKTITGRDADGNTTTWTATSY